MLFNRKVFKMMRRAFRYGQKKASIEHRAELKNIMKTLQANYKTMRALHESEIRQMKKLTDSQLQRLQFREQILERSIATWAEKIEKAEEFLLAAKNSLSTRTIEKKEIFQRLARHIAQESSEIDDLLNDVERHRLKVLEKTSKLDSKLSQRNV